MNHDELDAGLFEPLLVFLLQHRSDRIEDHPHLHAALAGAFERLQESLADRPLLEDVGFEVDAGLGLLDGLEHRRKRLPVAKHRVGVAGFHRGPDERGGIVGKPRIGGFNRTLDAQRVLVLRDEEQNGDDEHPNRDAIRPLAPLAFGARRLASTQPCTTELQVLSLVCSSEASVPANVRLNGAFATPTGVTSP